MSTKALPLKQLVSDPIDLELPEYQLALKNSNGAKQNLLMLEDIAKKGGGERGIQRHTLKNKKILPRKRLEMLKDEDSPFLEIGILAGFGMDYGDIPAASLIAGIAKIHGHYCLMGVNDATFKGGTLFPISVEKQIRLQQLGLINCLPSVYIVDSGGAFLPLQANIFPDRNHGGRMFRNEAVNSARGIPQISIVCGSSTAGGAYCPTMAEEAIIVDKIGTIFLGGPPLVKAATGEIVSEEDLGGAKLHCSVSGATDYFACDEEEAFDFCRESFYLLGPPQQMHSNSYPNIEPSVHHPDTLPALAGKSILSKDDVIIILSQLLDGSMFKGFKDKFGQNLLTGFGFLKGQRIGILANWGNLTATDCQKGTHFIQLCERRDIPLLFLQNSGRGPTIDYPEDGTILKDRSKLIAAHSTSSLPKISLNIGGCYGDDNFTMCGPSFKPNFYLSWPLAHSSITRCEISENKSISIPTEDIDNLFEDNTSSLYLASRVAIDAVILPENTRNVLSMCLEIAVAADKRKQFQGSLYPIFRM